MNVLVFAPHNDDEVLGCGGTIHKHVLNGDSVSVCEVTSGVKYKILQAEAAKAHAVLGVSESLFLNFPASGLAEYPKTELNRKVDEIVKKVEPQIVYMPFIGDMHLDHRYVTEAVLVAIRPINNCSVRQAYMYETLSETGWNIPYGERNFMPNMWIDITENLEKKIDAMECYSSQIKEYPNPRSKEAIKALAMYRGSTVSLPYAEAFMTVREIWGGYRLLKSIKVYLLYRSSAHEECGVAA